LLLGKSSSVTAALIDRGGGLIYDDTLNITWLQDANMAKSMGQSKDGLMTASGATKWAEGLVYQGYTDWRLPDARNPEKSDPKYDWNIRTSEMGHLFYDELGNSATLKAHDRSALKNSSPFVNLQPFRYWTGTKYNMSSDFYWYFDFGSGCQWDAFASARSYAWAVRDGDSRPMSAEIGQMPAPPAFALTATPSVAAIPGSEVSVARVEEAEIFLYLGYWWRTLEGRWYRASGYNGPWNYVRPKMVPAALIGLPPDYKKHLDATKIE
jgi:hypothetical protein